MNKMNGLKVQEQLLDSTNKNVKYEIILCKFEIKHVAVRCNSKGLWERHEKFVVKKAHLSQISNTGTFC